MARRVFDRCLTCSCQNSSSQELGDVTFNYEFLDDTYNVWMVHDDASKIFDGSQSGMCVVHVYCLYVMLHLHEIIVT